MELADCSLWHHLIFCEKLVIDGKEMEKDVEEQGIYYRPVESDTEEVESGAENNSVCRVCKKAVSGCPAYKCLECNFLIHASCSEMNWVWHRSFKNRHHLIYVEEGEKCKGHDFYEGKYRPYWGIEAVCVGCKEPASGPTYKCTFRYCPFLIHKSCTHHSHVIPYHAKQPDHISSLQLRKRSESKRCDVCGDTTNLLFLVYHCPICDFTTDMKCFSYLQINPDDHHQHALIPILEPISFSCQACGVDESKIRAHVCSGCGVLIHRECGKFPHTIKVYFHGHSLTRTYSISRVKKQDPIFCNFCYKKVNTRCGAYYCRQ